MKWKMLSRVSRKEKERNRRRSMNIQRKEKDLRKLLTGVKKRLFSTFEEFVGDYVRVAQVKMSSWK